MKATGIVRRIDDLGRVVIPKEIRRTLRIREGDPLEIFVDRDGEVILKKYSPIQELGEFSRMYADALFDTTQQPVLICDRDAYIAVGGQTKKDFLNKSIGEEVGAVIDARQVKRMSEQTEVELVDGMKESVAGYVIAPIIASGDSMGAVILYVTDGKEIGDTEQKLAETAAAFLGKHMED